MEWLSASSAGRPVQPQYGSTPGLSGADLAAHHHCVLAPPAQQLLPDIPLSLLARLSSWWVHLRVYLTGDGRRAGGCTGQAAQAPRAKRPRLTWTPELHARFEKACAALGGLEVAQPHAIHKLMAVQGLLTSHIKSHLQKVRQDRKIPAPSQRTLLRPLPRAVLLQGKLHAAATPAPAPAAPAPAPLGAAAPTPAPRAPLPGGPCKAGTPEQPASQQPSATSRSVASGVVGASSSDDSCTSTETLTHARMPRPAAPAGSPPRPPAPAAGGAGQPEFVQRVALAMRKQTLLLEQLHRQVEVRAPAAALLSWGGHTQTPVGRLRVHSAHSARRAESLHSRQGLGMQPPTWKQGKVCS